MMTVQVLVKAKRRRLSNCLVSVAFTNLSKSYHLSPLIKSTQSTQLNPKNRRKNVSSDP